MNNKVTLLYAEDEVETRQNHIEYLQVRYDFNYLEAANGEEALALFEVHRPEILLTDIEMPHMDGLTFIQHVRKHSPHTKIIVLTAYDDYDKLMRSLEMNVVNYLLKPINRKRLSSAVDLALETLPNGEDKNYICRIDADTIWNVRTHELYRCGDVVILTQREKRLLALLIEYKSIEVSSYDIYAYVWDDPDIEFNMDSVRTLIKNLRKKLPGEVLSNSYGGFYKLE